jgi:hypothetical protein
LIIFSFLIFLLEEIKLREGKKRNQSAHLPTVAHQHSIFDAEINYRVERKGRNQIRARYTYSVTQKMTY